jgi:hypothetical protein
LLGVSSFGSWDPEVLNKTKEPNTNAHPALGNEGIGVHYAQAPLHAGKKRKDTPMPKLQVLSTKNPTTTKKPQIIATEGGAN